MIILDTNVLSEAMRQAPDPLVIAWLDHQIVQTLSTTAITVGEIATGIAVLPTGSKSKALQNKFTTILTALEHRVIPFDESAALAIGRIFAIAKAAGFGMGLADAQIAAIATIAGATVATRDTAPFLAVGVKVINPWVSF